MGKPGKATTVFETPWFTIDAVPYDSPTKKPYYRLSCSNAVEVLAVTTKKEVLLVHQYRPAIERSHLELPSGYIDRGETARQAAARELKEETGYVCSSMARMGTFTVAPDRIKNSVEVYFGSGARRVREPHSDEGTAVVAATFPEFKRLILSGEFRSVSGMAFFYLAKLKGLI